MVASQQPGASSRIRDHGTIDLRRTSDDRLKPSLVAVIVPSQTRERYQPSDRGEHSFPTHLLDWAHQRLENFTCGPGYVCGSEQETKDFREITDNGVCCGTGGDIDDSLENDIVDASATTSSLYRKAMTTAALANSGSSGDVPDAPQPLKKAANVARGFADDASKAIGNLLPTASLQNITTRRYTLPDKTVASQVLMYRQLLHTACRPGLKLSRPYQATVAQQAVKHMPWWEKGIDESKKMVISYDNLITRLWLNGAIYPWNKDSGASSTGDLLDLGSDAGASTAASVDTLFDDKGLPPVPHEYWVDRLGFQQTDPVTDFRSGGVLSLGMLVYMVESCPEICERFFTGDASVLPFGITCINVTDMMAKFLMLAKSTDRMDALLSQKPFWRMFADPNAITALQELSMTMLCDVVVELGQERRVPGLVNDNNSLHDTSNGKVRLCQKDGATDHHSDCIA